MKDLKLNMSALVVDDVVLNRKMMKKSLKHLFDSFDDAEDGVIAVGKVQEAMSCGSMFDVIFMDFMMPNMDGPTATSAIRALGYMGLIVGVTGNALPEDIQYFKNKGVNQVFLKPLDVQACEEIVTKERCNNNCCCRICGGERTINNTNE